MLELPFAKSTIKLGPHQVLKNCACVVHTRRCLLSVHGLSEHVSHNRSQATRAVEFDLERPVRKKLMNTLDSECFDWCQRRLMFPVSKPIAVHIVRI